MSDPYISLDAWQSWAVSMLSGMSDAERLTDDELRARVAGLLKRANDNLTSVQERCTQQLLVLRAVPRIWSVMRRFPGGPVLEHGEDGPEFTWFDLSRNACLCFFVADGKLTMLALKDNRAVETPEPSGADIAEAAERLFGAE